MKYSSNLLIYHHVKLPKRPYSHYQECANTRHKRHEKYDVGILFLVNNLRTFSMRNQIFMNRKEWSIEIYSIL